MLEVRNLSVHYKTARGIAQAVNGIDFSVQAGEIVGIVGESGSGKSQTLYAMMGLLKKNVTLTGSILFQGQEILQAPENILNQLRGKNMSLIFQDPMTALNPTLPIGVQISEGLVHHKGLSWKEAYDLSLEVLERVGLADPKRQMSSYPHHLSGGMRQRIVIAMAMINNPALLLADEPTTALDVTIQAEILSLLATLRKKGTSIILVTHDLGVIAHLCDRVLVMYAGQIVETGTVDDIFYDPKHPYTQALLRTIPRLDKVDSCSIPIEGMPPNPYELPKGCSFAPRCPQFFDRCHDKPPLSMIAQDRLIACYHNQPLSGKV